MLTSLSLGNFKAFSDVQNIPIKPITLIFGPNSAGKSSLIHGLLLAHHANETGELDAHLTGIGGDSVDLGGFQQYVHRRDTTQTVAWSATIDFSGFAARRGVILNSARQTEISVAIGMVGDKPYVKTCDITVDGAILIAMFRRPDNTYRMSRLDYHHPLFRQVIETILESVLRTTPTEEAIVKVNRLIDDVILQMPVEAGNLLPFGLTMNLDASHSDEAVAGISLNADSTSIDAALQFYLPRIVDEFIRDIHAVLSGELNRLQYLGPLRSYPPRQIIFSQHHDRNWIAGGGFAWDVVRKNAAVRAKVNLWLGKHKLDTPYELEVRNLVTLDDLGADYEQQIESIEQRFTGQQADFDLFGELYGVLNRMKSTEEHVSTAQELRLIDKRGNTPVSHRDVGIGISQVLPVLVSAFASTGKILAIEQPEIHLHPAMQAEIADVFIESALAGQNNTFLIETHSEHLILRILRRIRETADGELEEGMQPISPQDVQVIYAKPTNKGTVLYHLPIREDGDFDEKWPDGFFAERAKELF
ncbi:MAG TPA: DUF3696 domain-containing protein [Desulfuromonadales bacterium]|nr:DUF3696 domain-containing protein [Desulfuromonadales bacterium]